MVDLVPDRFTELLEKVKMEVVPLVLAYIELVDVGVDMPLVKSSASFLHNYFICYDYIVHKACM
jgi:hypothetical protein